jgi:glyoxylase-like metal-dependent hydrolase (beta-lactamase superfamily II)
MTAQHFTLREVVAGVWLAEADISGTSVGNATIIDLGGKTIVVDTFMTDIAATELRATAEKLTGNRVHLAVNTHWHGDHTNGNQVFADVPIVATRTTLEKVLSEAPTDLGAWQSEIEASITSLQEAADGGDAAALHRIEILQHFHRFAGDFSVTLPNLLIEDRLVVQGERRVEISTHGRGHTVSDIIAWLPDDRVLISGDLCWNRIHPRTRDGFPLEWATYTERLIALEPKHVIPGHGEVGDASALEELPAYFRELDALVDAVAAGADPAGVEPPGVSEDWAGIQRFRTGLTRLAALRH